MRISDWSSDVCSSDLLHPPSYLLHPPSGGEFRRSFHLIGEAYRKWGLLSQHKFGLHRGLGEYHSGFLASGTYENSELPHTDGLRLHPYGPHLHAAILPAEYQLPDCLPGKYSSCFCAASTQITIF